MKKIVFLALFFCSASIIFAQRATRFEVKVPSMNCEQCEQIIQDRLWKRVDGIVEIDAKWKAKKVVIKFIPDRIDSANIKLLIADLGFDASDELADEDAMKKLPECCRRVVKPKPVAPTPPPTPAVVEKPKAVVPVVKPTPTKPNTTKPAVVKPTPTKPTKPVVKKN